MPAVVPPHFCTDLEVLGAWGSFSPSCVGVFPHSCSKDMSGAQQSLGGLVAKLLFLLQKLSCHLVKTYVGSKLESFSGHIVWLPTLLQKNKEFPT